MWRVPYYLIRVYQRVLSPLIPPTCRYHPTCSHYGAEALQVHGFWLGSWLTVKRVLRCHPWHPGGFDPVPACKDCKTTGSGTGVSESNSTSDGDTAHG